MREHGEKRVSILAGWRDRGRLLIALWVLVSAESGLAALPRIDMPLTAPQGEPDAVRTIRGVACMCPSPSVLSDGDFIAGLGSAPSSLRPWLVETGLGAAGSRKTFTLFGAPTLTGPDYRMGPTSLTAWMQLGPESAEFTWRYGPIGSWLQLAGTNAALGTPRERRDSAWPIDIPWVMGKGPITDVEAIALVRFVRAEGVKASSDPAKTVRPWRIERISPAGAMSFRVDLHAPAAAALQIVTVKKTGTGWVVDSVRTIEG